MTRLPYRSKNFTAVKKWVEDAMVSFSKKSVVNCVLYVYRRASVVLLYLYLTP